MGEKKLPTVQEPSNEECILVLENLKERTTRYGSLFRHYPKDYLDRLAETNATVLNKVISILKNREK